MQSRTPLWGSQLKGVVVAAQVTQSPSADVWRLVRQAQAGDSEAFGQVYEQYVDSVFQFFYLRVDNRQSAEKLTEETFLWAMRNILLLNQLAWHTPLAWLIWRARSLAADRFVPEYPSHLEVNYPEYNVPVPITQLPFELQECVVFRLFMQLEPAEIAQIMGRTVDNLKEMGEQIDRRIHELVG